MAGSLLEIEDDKTPAGNPPAGDPPVGDPPAGDPSAAGDPPPAGERPDWVPEAAWVDGKFDESAYLSHVRGTRAPEAYELPDIDGFDKDAAASSPIMATLMAQAKSAGLSQEEFAATVTDWTTKEVEAAEARTAAELKALGENAKERVGRVQSWLKASLPLDEAQAVAATATTAKAVIGLEKLMTRAGGGRGAGSEPAPDAGPAGIIPDGELHQLMNSKEYSGKSHERNPQVIARVDAHFKAVAAAKKAKK